MKITKEFAAVHGYLCSDGYVIKNPQNQNHKYYYIGFRNYNTTLLNDFYKNFYKYFNKKPHIVEGRVRIGSKKIYNYLINNFKSFYSKDWSLPKLNKENLKIWLRAYFDCESWVFCIRAKDRHVGLDSINYNGLIQIQKSLLKFNINSRIKNLKNRKIFRLLIFGKDNIIKFQKEINYLHPEKETKLQEAINSYINYNWNLKNFKNILKEKVKIKKPFYLRIISNLENNLIRLSLILKSTYNINSIIYKEKNSVGTIYYSLLIQRKGEVEKVLKSKLLPYAYERQIKKNLGI